MRMTEAEKSLAAQHHNEVYSFLRRERLDFSEWYGIVITGYLAACMDYSRRETARKYSFVTIASRKMQDAVLKHYRAEMADKRRINHEAVSLNAEMDDSEMEYMELVQDPENGIDDFIDAYGTAQIIAEIKGKLSPRERTVFTMMLTGARQAAIQRECNLSYYGVRSAIEKIRKVTAAAYSA